MNNFTIGQSLPPFTVIGLNYAEDHDNKIHSNDVASQFGFKGGLVPGVGIYAYLTHPVVEAFGIEWLQRGAIQAKFLKPVYHGEEVRVRGQFTNETTLQLELLNPAGTLCAIATASLPASRPKLNPADFPAHVLPEQRPAATIANLPVGMRLGSIYWQLDLTAVENKFLNDVCATLPLYRGTNAVCHPAYYLAQANEMLMANVQLGPWIHTGSEVQHFAAPNDGAQLSLRGTILEAIEKRGHEIVTLTLGLFTEESQPIAYIRHTAIVRLRSIEIT